MKTKLVTLSLLFIGIAGISFIKPNEKVLHGDHFGLGKKAPMTTVEMRNIDEKMLTLEGAKLENGLLVVFSCNTCPFVVGNNDFAGWERQYNDLYKTAKDAKIGMVLINSNEGKRADEDAFEAMKSHAKKEKYKMPYLLDKNSQLADAFEAKTTPHVYLLDKDMTLIYVGSIDNTYDPKRTKDENYLLDAIANVKEGKTVTTNTTAPRGCSIKRVKL